MKYLLVLLCVACIALWVRLLTEDAPGMRFAAPSGTTVALVSGPRGRILVSGGHDPPAMTTWLGKNLPFHVREIDALIVTDFGRTFSGSVPEILRRYRVGWLMVPSTIRRTALSQQVRALARQLGARVAAVTSPLELEDGLHRLQLLPVLGEDRLLVLIDGPAGRLVVAHVEDATDATRFQPSILVFRQLPAGPISYKAGIVAMPGPGTEYPQALDFSRQDLWLP